MPSRKIALGILWPSFRMALELSYLAHTIDAVHAIAISNLFDLILFSSFYSISTCSTHWTGLNWTDKGWPIIFLYAMSQPSVGRANHKIWYIKTGNWQNAHEPVFFLLTFWLNSIRCRAAAAAARKPKRYLTVVKKWNKKIYFKLNVMESERTKNQDLNETKGRETQFCERIKLKNHLMICYRKSYCNDLTGEMH